MPSFEFYDPAAPLTVTRRNLPHWHQNGATCFVTFRTADSLPAEVIGRYKERRHAWLLAHGVDPVIPNWRSAFDKLPRIEQADFQRRFQREFQELLDAGHGACALRRPELAAIVADAIRYFDGERYHVSDFVVMPNHVHVLMGLIGEHTVDTVTSSWKHFTATKINRVLGTTGHFWQGESFDHLVRSEEQFLGLREYIAQNPVKAGLGPTEHLLYRVESAEAECRAVESIPKSPAAPATEWRTTMETS
jgi:REP element-mobilizing transposase RayT